MLAVKQADRLRLMEAALVSSAQGVIIIDAEGPEVFQNEVCRRLALQGLLPTASAEEQAAEPKLHYADGQPMAWEDTPLHRAMRSESIVELKVLLRKPDGGDAYISSTAGPVRDEQGNTIGAICIFHEVTEQLPADRRAAELGDAVLAVNEQLTISAVSAKEAAERDILQTIMENTRAQLAYLDRDFKVVRVNSAYIAGSGHSEAELLGRNHFDLFPSAENQAIFERVRDTGEAAEFHDKPFEYVDQPERGVTYWDWTLSPIKDARGQVQGLVLSLMDVTERKEAELLREEYVSLISHDLRNPLTGMLGHADWLRRLLANQGLEREKQSAEAILASAKRMNAMVEDLVGSTRLEASGHEFVRTPPISRS